MSNTTLFVLMGLGAVGIYWGSHELLSRKNIPYVGPPPTPTITFVPHGTPGAKTFQEWQKERLEESRRRWR